MSHTYFEPTADITHEDVHYLTCVGEEVDNYLAKEMSNVTLLSTILAKKKMSNYKIMQYMFRYPQLSWIAKHIDNRSSMSHSYFLRWIARRIYIRIKRDNYFSWFSLDITRQYDIED